MDAAIHPLRPGRGAGLLLAHCEALADVNVERTPPFARLEGLVGSELARLLVFALSGVHGRRRGSSSP
jgi:hypothetical protein